MDEIVMEYLGDGNRFLNGVSTNGITRAEWDTLTPEQQAIVRDSGLYREVEAKAQPAKGAFSRVATAPSADPTSEVKHE